MSRFVPITCFQLFSGSYVALFTIAGHLLLFSSCTSNLKKQNQNSAQETVFLNYTKSALDSAYQQGPWAPNASKVLGRLSARNEEAIVRIGQPERITYGPTAYEELDIYRTYQANAPVHLYIHGGAWRGGNGSGTTAATAEVFIQAGALFVAPDYQLVQDAEGSLFPMVDQLRRAVVWIYSNIGDYGGNKDKIFLSGHSAGGHLAAVLLTTNWEEFGLPENIFQGALISSGMFDLHPVSLSSRNQYVSFTDEMVEQLSPINFLDILTTPVIISFGTEETPEFQRQSQAFFDLLKGSGKETQLLICQQCNHFEIMESMANPYGIQGNALLKLMELI